MIFPVYLAATRNKLEHKLHSHDTLLLPKLILASRDVHLPCLACHAVVILLREKSILGKQNCEEILVSFYVHLPQGCQTFFQGGTIVALDVGLGGQTRARTMHKGGGL